MPHKSQSNVVSRILHADWTDEPVRNAKNIELKDQHVIDAACTLGVHYGRRLPEIETTVLRILKKHVQDYPDPRYDEWINLNKILQYCKVSIGGRWPEIEPYLVKACCMSGVLAYWAEVGSGHWPECDDRLLKFIIRWPGIVMSEKSVMPYYDVVTNGSSEWWPEFYDVVRRNKADLAAFISHMKKKNARKWKKNPDAEADFIANAGVNNPEFLEMYYGVA
jgi:hypothetical protein